MDTGENTKRKCYSQFFIVLPKKNKERQSVKQTSYNKLNEPHDKKYS